MRINGARRAILTVILFGLTIGHIFAEDYFPSDEWRRSSLEKHGYQRWMMDRMQKRIEQEGQISSVIVVDRGEIVYEYYRRGYQPKNRFSFFSCTKSMISAAVGIAIDQGLILNEQEKVVDFIPQWKTASDSRKKTITIHHLLNMTSGLDWPESTSWGHNVGPLFGSGNWVEFITRRDIECNPGEKFNYNTGASHLLSYIVQKAAGKSTYSFMKENLFNRIGMTSVNWGSDPQGITMGGVGVEMTAEDAARFGYLYLRNGQWNGVSIISRAWVEKSTRTQSKGESWGGYGGEYGYQWWIGKFAEYRTFFAWGAREQYIFVVPALDLVVVFTSRSSKNGCLRPPDVLEKYIIPAGKK